VHFLGHVSNEELTAIYDVADVFLCASEHEGFCVPLVESFHKRVPVLAYAATAVPATMDGAGVLYDTKDPVHVAALLDAVVSDEALREAVIEAQDGALDRLFARDFAGRSSGSWAAPSPRPGPSTRAWRSTSGSRWTRPTASRNCDATGRRSISHCRRRPRRRANGQPMIVHQWVPAAHRGDAIGDSARRVRGLLRRMGHASEIFALTIDEDLVDDVRPFGTPTPAGGTSPCSTSRCLRP